MDTYKEYDELGDYMRRLRNAVSDNSVAILGLQNDLKRIKTELHERIDRLNKPTETKTHPIRVYFEKLNSDGSTVAFWVDTGHTALSWYRFSASDGRVLIIEAIGGLFGSNVYSTSVSVTDARTSNGYDCVVELRSGGQMRLKAKIEYGRLR